MAKRRLTAISIDSHRIEHAGLAEDIRRASTQGRAGGRVLLGPRVWPGPGGREDQRNFRLGDILRQLGKEKSKSAGHDTEIISTNLW